MGFPTDLKYREVHNLFRYQSGYERCTVNLKRSYPTVFVTFKTRDEAQAAMDQFQGIQFDPDYENSVLKIEWAKSNTSSRGGSFGARKRPRMDSYQQAPMNPAAFVPAPMSTPMRHPLSAGSYRGGPRGNPIQTLFIHGIDGASDEEVKQLYASQPGYLQTRLSRKNGLVAWVHFSSTEAATAAAHNTDGTILHGMAVGASLKADYAKKPMSYSGPSSGSGGYGQSSYAHSMMAQGMAMDPSMYGAQYGANPYYQ